MSTLPKQVAAARPSYALSGGLFSLLLLMSVSVYLAILIPHRVGVLPALRWWQLLQFALALAALAAFRFGSRERSEAESGKLPLPAPTRSSSAGSVALPATAPSVSPVYFALVTLGLCVALTIFVLALHQERIESCALAFEGLAWVMTTLLALLAASNRQPQQAVQWLARSVAMTATYIVIPLLGLLSGVFRLQPDVLGLMSTILVFAALLSADIVLNWREITTRRG